MNYKRYCLFLFLAAVLTSGVSAKSKPAVDKAKAVNRLSASDQRRFDYYFYEGIRLKNNQQYDDALEAFRFCLALDSLDAGALSETGMMYASLGLMSEATRCMEQSLKSDPGNWWYSLQMISLYSNEKKWKQAVAVALDLQARYPNREEVYDMLTSLYKQTGELDKAIAAYDRLESLTGIDQSISFEKFRLYILSNKPKKGIAEIDKLVNRYPTVSRYKVLRGDIFMQQKMPEKAFEIYQNVLKEDPEDALVYVSLSEYYNSDNQPAKALESIVNALKSDRLDVDMKVEVLGQYVEKLVKDSTRFVETESLFKLLVDRYPLEEQVHSYYALFLEYQKRNAEALSELETMLNINPKNEQTWMRLIQFHMSKNDVEGLLGITARAIENLPQAPLLYFYRAIAQYQQKDYKSSLATSRKALPLIKPEQAALKSDSYAQIADCFFKLGEKDSAFVNYDRALEANPRNLMVMNNYAYYLSLEKRDLRKAERMSAKTVEAEPKNSTYLDTYAWILYQEGSYSLAKLYIEQAIDNLPKGEDNGVLLDHYGDILWMLKSDGKALEMWKKSYDSGNKTDELKKKIDNKGWER